MDSLVAVIALGAVVAGFVQDLSGFGLRIVATAFWAWTVDPKLAAALAVFGSHAGQWLVVFTVRRRFDAPRLLPFIAGGVVGVPVGVARLPMLDANLFKAILGVLLVTWGPAMSMAKQLPRIGAGGPLADGAIGVVGGVTGGIGGFTGSIPTLWCKLQGMDKDAQRAVAWGLTQAARLGGNPKRVFVMGHSAGAYNAAMLALDPRWLAATGHTPAELASWIGLAGPYDFFPTDNLDAQPVFFHPNYPPHTQPIEFASASAPRSFLGAPVHDVLVSPTRSTLSLAAGLKAADVPVTLRMYERASHTTLISAFAWPLRWVAPVLDDVSTFVDAAGHRHR